MHSDEECRKKLNLGLAAGPVDHVVVPPIDGFHADAVLAQWQSASLPDDHMGLERRAASGRDLCAVQVDA